MYKFRSDISMAEVSDTMFSLSRFRLFHELGECFGDKRLLKPGGLQAVHPEACELFSHIAAELGEGFWTSEKFLDTKAQEANKRGARGGGHKSAYDRGDTSWEPAERVMFYFKFLRNIYVHQLGTEKLHVARTLPEPLSNAVRSGAISGLTSRLQKKMAPAATGPAATDPASAALGGCAGRSATARRLPPASASTLRPRGVGACIRSWGYICGQERRTLCMAAAATDHQASSGGGGAVFNARRGFLVSKPSNAPSSQCIGNNFGRSAAARQRTLLLALAVPRGGSAPRAFACW